MENTLFVFIDESGNPNNGDLFNVAGCWCVSHRSDIEGVLSPTKNRLAGVIENEFSEDPIGEIKGSELPPLVIDMAVQSLERFISNDETIVRSSGLPWQHHSPLRCSTHSLNPAVAIEALDTQFNSSLSAGQLVRLISLLAVINPIFYTETVDVSKVEKIRVILDAEVWQRPSQIVQSGIGNSVDLENVEFTTEDSKGVPGLQIADLAAYAWGRNIRKGDCTNASGVIGRFCL